MRLFFQALRHVTSPSLPVSWRYQPRVANLPPIGEGLAYHFLIGLHNAAYLGSSFLNCKSDVCVSSYLG